MLTASRASEYSFEGEPVAGSEMPGSVFTGALVEGIRSGAADLDKDGLISVDDAYGYAFERLRIAGAHQTPQRWLYGAEGDIFLARSSAGITIAPAPLPDGIGAALESPHTEIRLGAVQALGDWLSDGNLAHAVAARQALQRVADSDMPRVAQAAVEVLGTEPANPEGSPARPTVKPAAPASSAQRDGRSWTSTNLGGHTSGRGRLLIVGTSMGVLVVISLIVWFLLPDVTKPPTTGGSMPTESGTGSAFSAQAPWASSRTACPGTVGNCPFTTIRRRAPATGTRWPGRPHALLDMAATPLWPFGHGLSHTMFALSDLQCGTEIDAYGTARISATITNTGDRDGAAVVQLYLRVNTKGITRPAQQLGGFTRLELSAGERRRLTFKVDASQLAYTNLARQVAVEPADVHVFMGLDSDDRSLEGSFEVTGEPRMVAGAERSFLWTATAGPVVL